MKILIVDEDRMFSKLLEDVARDAGHELMTAFEVDTAVQVLKENPGISLVIVDKDIRPGGAYHLVKAIRISLHGKRIWVTNHDGSPRTRLLRHDWMDVHRIEKFLLKTQVSSELSKELQYAGAG